MIYPNTHNIDPDEIAVPPGRMRALDDATVEAISASILRMGQRHPIAVRWGDEGWVLVAGGHRLEALKRINARAGGEEPRLAITQVFDEELKARLWEIAENLHRAELTALERSEHIAEWIKLTEQDRAEPAEAKAGAAEGVSAQLAPKLSSRGRDGEGRPETGINLAARSLGLERTDAQRAVKVASITPEAKQAAIETGLDDNRSALLKIAHIEPEQQAEQVQKIVAEQRERKNRQAAQPSPVQAPPQSPRSALAVVKAALTGTPATLAACLLECRPDLAEEIAALAEPGILAFWVELRTQQKAAAKRTPEPPAEQAAEAEQPQEKEVEPAAVTSSQTPQPVTPAENAAHEPEPRPDTAHQLLEQWEPETIAEVVPPAPQPAPMETLSEYLSKRLLRTPLHDDCPLPNCECGPGTAIWHMTNLHASWQCRKHNKPSLAETRNLTCYQEDVWPKAVVEVAT